MKRSTLLALAVVTLAALQAAPALAGKKSRKHDQSEEQQQDQQQNPQHRHFNVQSLLNGQVDWQQVFKKHKKHHDESPVVPLDPGRGDGRVPVEPVTPQGRPGFVWVKDHWERARAPKLPQVIVDPIPPQNGPIVRDHRDGLGANGGVTVTTTQNGPIVRDHRDSTTIFNPTGGKTWTVGPTIRDHRTTTPPPVSNGQGGVTVASGAGLIVRDHRTTTPPPLVSGQGGGVTVTTTPGDGSATSGPTIRDHRTSGPIVRDHRK